MKGRYHTEEAKRKNAEAHRGKKPWNWRGGFLLCPICSKRLSSYKSKFCRKHAPVALTEEGRKRIGESSTVRQKGVKLSEEHKKHLSLSHKGKNLSDSHREKLKGHIPWNKNKKGVMPIPWNRGTRVPEETKEKIRRKLKGRFAGENHPHWGKKFPERSGPNNHNWRGGTSSENDKIRKGASFRIWREQVFDRDDYTCQICGEKGGILNADHIKPFSLFPELRFELSNGRTLCKKCHMKTDTWGTRALKFKVK